MTNDQIIEMAKQAEVFIAGNPKHIIAFARLIEKQVREEDADSAEAWLNGMTNSSLASDCAAAIRNSGGE